MDAAEMKVILYLIRYLIGYNRDTDRIAVSQICHKIKMSDSSVRRAIKSLKKKDIIEELAPATASLGAEIGFCNLICNNDNSKYKIIAEQDMDDMEIDRDTMENDSLYIFLKENYQGKKHYKGLKYYCNHANEIREDEDLLKYYTIDIYKKSAKDYPLLYVLEKKYYLSYQNNFIQVKKNKEKEDYNSFMLLQEDI
jgi:phage replication O-like protein O